MCRYYCYYYSIVVLLPVCQAERTQTLLKWVEGGRADIMVNFAFANMPPRNTEQYCLNLPMFIQIRAYIYVTVTQTM